MDFAIKIIKLCETIKGHYSLVNQLERSATSIGANIHEANYAHGKADFIAKLRIALKEAKSLKTKAAGHPMRLLFFYPNATSRLIITAKPMAKNTIPLLLPFSPCISSESSFITTKIMVPAAKERK